MSSWHEIFGVQPPTTATTTTTANGSNFSDDEDDDLDHDILVMPTKASTTREQTVAAETSTSLSLSTPTNKARTRSTNRRRAYSSRSGSGGGGGGRQRAEATAAVHGYGGGDAGGGFGGVSSVSAVVFKAFRDKFLRRTNNEISGSGGVDYKQLRQRDVEVGNEAGISDGEHSSGNSSSAESESSVEDLFVAQTRRKLRRKVTRGRLVGQASGRRRYLPAAHHQQQQHYRYYKQSKLGQLGQSLSQQQQQQQCVRHTNTPLTHNFNATTTPTTKWQSTPPQNLQHQLSNNSGEFDEYHWQQNQSKQQQQQQQQHNNNTNNNANYTLRSGANMLSGIGGGGVGGGILGVGSKVYITPADIPPPPPHPASSIGNTGSINSKRYNSTGDRQQQQQQQQQMQHHQHSHPHQQQQLPYQQPLPPPPHRCKCEHPIEVLRHTPSHKYPHTQHQHQQQHQHSQQHLHDDVEVDYEDEVIAANDARHHFVQGQQQQQPHSSSLSLSRQHHYATTHAQYLKQQQQQQQQQQQHYRGPTKLHGSMVAIDDGDSIAGHQRFKNLVYSKEKIRRIRIILSVVAGIFIICLLATALYFIFSPDNSKKGGKSNDAIDLEDVLSGQLQAKRFNGSWTQSGNLIYRENGGIVEYDVKTHEKTLLLANSNHYVLYEKSADNQFLLLAKNYKKNFRYSYIAEYDIYNISSGQVQPLTIQNEQRFLLMVQWAPVGNGLIINYERNLYYKPSPFAAEITITNDENAAILNGIPDWVYEEEVLGSNIATWFNAAGTQIAFIRFDDTPTHVINFPYYGDAGDLRYQYPFNHLIAYPKAGSSNPRVELFTADLERAANGGSSFLTQIPVASALNTETDYIITVVSWLDNNNVLSVWMNRIQNLAYMQVFDGVSRHEIYNVESKTGWIDLFTAPFKNRNGSRIALILPQAQTNGDNFQHLALLSTTSQSKPTALTKGNYIVDSILHWDRTNDIIFYTANTEQNPEHLHIYSIKATTDQTPKCLTCKLHSSDGVEQNYYAAEFNSGNHVIISSQGPGIPIVSLYEWSYTNNQVTLKKLVDWETNDVLRGKLKGVAMPTIEMLTIPISSGFTAKVLLQLPPNIDRSGKTKYPILVEVYGGPSSSAVVSRWTLDWGTYLSSNQSVIYAKIDGRGSNLRGEKLLHSVYLKLGTVEISDQIDVTQQLQEKYNFIDAEHTGIWGWSYGGYAAAMALANDEKKVFKCAASVAPVTDWAYYDSIYTERYMGLPEPNEVGYTNSRLSTRAQNLRGKKYMLIHGTLDDNVHYQQSMILAKNLERHDILFKQISYTDEDHGLVNVRPHLYHSLDRFFGECFASNRLMMSAK